MTLLPLTVFYSASSYRATEGGAEATVTVRMSPAADRQVSLPIRVTRDAGTESGDYSRDLGSGHPLSFSRGASSRSFAVTAEAEQISR